MKPRTSLATLLDRLATREGTHPTAVPGVELARTSYSGRCRVMYEPMIYIMGQGRKRGFLGSEVLRYDPDNYLVLSVPVPLECEFDATPENRFWRSRSRSTRRC